MLKFERTESGFSFDLGCRQPRLLRICCGPLNLILPLGFIRFLVYQRNVIGMDGASCSLGFHSSRVTSAFVVDLYVGLPSAVSSVRTSWDLTGQAHEPFSRGESTIHPDAWPTANRICRRADDPWRAGPSCFTDSRRLALRLGRNVNPPRVLFPGSFDTTC
jgi:hypothetical protein